MVGVVKEVNERMRLTGDKNIDRDQRERLLSLPQFAYDFALTAESARKLQCLCTEFVGVCERRKLRVNVEKTRLLWWEGKVLRSARRHDDSRDHEGREFFQV